MTTDLKTFDGAHPQGLDLAKTVLVTGGAGFIGQRLVHRLLDEDFSTHVVILDSGMSGDLKGLTESLDKRLSLLDPRGNRAVRTAILQGDVRDLNMYSALAQAIPQLKFPPLREVYHLACPATPAIWEKHPVDTLLTSVVGTANVLLFCDKIAPNVWRGFKPPRVVFASSSEVYGRYYDPDWEGPGDSPINEDYRGDVPFRGPRACYAEGKRAAEALIHDVVRTSQRELDARTARLFNVYGPGMRLDDGRAVSAFIAAALKNESLTVSGDGKQTRCFTYVDDVVRGLTSLMSAEADPGPVNLGDPAGETTIHDLAERIRREVGGPYQIVKDGVVPIDEPRYQTPDVTKAREKLGWGPRVGLEEGLKLTVADLREQLEAKEAEGGPKLVVEGSEA